jgi:hypothetical protein
VKFPKSFEYGEYYFMPNVYRSVKARHAYRIVRVHGELRRQEVWVDKLVDLNRKKGGRAKTTWDWANDDFWVYPIGKGCVCVLGETVTVTFNP